MQPLLDINLTTKLEIRLVRKQSVLVSVAKADFLILKRKGKSTLDLPRIKKEGWPRLLDSEVVREALVARV